MRNTQRGVAWLPPLLLPALLVAGCTGIFGTEDHLLVEVAEGVVPCIGEGVHECLLVRTQGDADYNLFYGGITGFTPESGYRYRLRVSWHAIANPPADGSSAEYRLVRVESKVRSPRYGDLLRLREELAKWRATRPVPYDLVLERLCFCAPEGRGPVRVQVAVPPSPGLEMVVDRHYVDGGQRVPTEMRRFFPHVEGLFGMIVQAVARDVHVLDVAYHPAMGYPTRISIDPSAGVADDEVEYRALGVMLR